MLMRHLFQKNVEENAFKAPLLWFGANLWKLKAHAGFSHWVRGEDILTPGLTLKATESCDSLKQQAFGMWMGTRTP